MDQKELERLIPKNAYKGLLEYEIITIQNNKVSIDFLDEQMNEIDKVREANSRAGKRSAEARKQRKLNEGLTTVQRNSTDKDKDKDIEDINNNVIYRSFNHLSITYGELRKLLEVYSIESVNHTLDSIENYKNNKQYKSLYLTAKNWLKGHEHKQPENDKKVIFDTYANNIMKKINK